MNKVLNGGHWFIGEHFLAIRLWEPNFKPFLAGFTLVAVWARLNELPIEYYEPLVIRDVGRAIGPVLRIEFNTATLVIGRYARICVQVDLNKPLIRTVLIGKLVQPVAYKSIGSLCFECGRLGHKNLLAHT